VASEELRCLSGSVIEAEHTVRVLYERNTSLEETIRRKVAEAVAVAANALVDAAVGKRKIQLTLET
jgi:hypothetical protein